VRSPLAVGRGGLMFSKEKSKQRVLSDVFKNNPVLVIGYSGGDKVDVMPLLFSVESKYPIVWIQLQNPPLARYLRNFSLFYIM